MDRDETVSDLYIKALFWILVSLFCCRYPFPCFHSTFTHVCGLLAYLPFPVILDGRLIHVCDFQPQGVSEWVCVYVDGTFRASACDCVRLFCFTSSNINHVGVGGHVVQELSHHLWGLQPILECLVQTLATLLSIQLLLMYTLGDKWWLKFLGPWHSCGRPSAWHSCGCIWREEPVNARSFSICLLVTDRYM